MKQIRKTHRSRAINVGRLISIFSIILCEKRLGARSRTAIGLLCLSPEASGIADGKITGRLTRGFGLEDSELELGERRRETLDSDAGVLIFFLIGITRERERDLLLEVDRPADLLRSRPGD